jgi:hypothetical protein
MEGVEVIFKARKYGMSIPLPAHFRWDYPDFKQFWEWKEEQGNRFKSSSIRAVRYQHSVYEREYVSEYKKKNNILAGDISFLFFRAYGRAQETTNLVLDEILFSAVGSKDPVS